MSAALSLSSRSWASCGTHGTEHERACLDALTALLPGVESVNPVTHWRTNAGWLRAWSRLVSTLSGLAIFAGNGTVDAGCLREVIDAVVAGAPRSVLHPNFGRCELAAFDLLPPTMRTRTAAAWPVAGP